MKTWTTAAILALLITRLTGAGACCFDDGTCVNSPSEFFCSIVGGVYQGGGTTCATAVCTGSCCFTDGLCVDTTGTGCETSGGLFLGIGTDCSTSYCGEGACCLPDESCAMRTVFDCDAVSGVHLGPATNCGTTECTVQLVAGPLSPLPPIPLALPSFDEQGGLRELTGVIARLRTTVSLMATVENRSPLANVDTSLTITADLAGTDLPGVTLLAGGTQVAFAPPLAPDDGVDGGGADFHDFGVISFTERFEQCLTAPGALAPFVAGEPLAIEFNGVGGIDLSTSTPVELALGPFSAEMLVTLAYLFEPQGACCLPDGQCQLETAADCTAAVGVYQGDGVPCPRGPCPPLCAADIAGPAGPGVPDGNVDAIDLLALIGDWGCAGACLGDIDGPQGESDGLVDALDLLRLVAEWGTPSDCE